MQLFLKLSANRTDYISKTIIKTGRFLSFEWFKGLTDFQQNDSATLRHC